MTEKYVPNGKPLNAHERELLIILMEECGEVVQAASKLLRFGKENRPDSGESNSRVLGLECGDLEHMVARIAMQGIISMDDLRDGDMRKSERLECYLQTDR